MYSTSSPSIQTIWWLTLAGVVACTDGASNKPSGAEDSTGTQTGDSADEEDSGGGASGPCESGLEVDQCPPDVPLVDSSTSPHLFSDYRGETVLIIGAAEW